MLRNPFSPPDIGTLRPSPAHPHDRPPGGMSVRQFRRSRVRRRRPAWMHPWAEPRSIHSELLNGGATVTYFEFFIGFMLPPLLLLGIPIFLGYVVFRLIKPKVPKGKEVGGYAGPRI